MATKKPSIEMAYKDDVYQAITNQFQQIQECIGMYISAKGKEGAFHLFKEIFNNALDECVNANSPADTITIEFFADLGQFVVRDNGRGIPFEEMVKSCTEKHTSTKFNANRSFNKYSAGCNGVGLVVTTALSNYMEIKCVREYSDGESKEKTIKFNHCVLDEGKIKPSKNGKHGTQVTFSPSHEYLGDFEITADDIITWLRHMSYIMPPNVTIKFNYYPKEGDIPQSRVFTAVGLGENVKFLGTELEFEPVCLTYTEDEMELEFAFSYDKTVPDEVIDSYCNYVITTDGGYHEDACMSALCDFFVKAARKADPDAKYEVIRTDCRKGLVAAVNCRAMHVVLEGQHKSKVGSKEIADTGKSGILNGLTEYFSNNNQLLNKFITYLRQMAKIRIESFKIKGIKPPKPMTMYDEADIAEYCPISERNKKDYCELIITEGKSAAGAIKQTIHPYYQALYVTRGVLTNVAEMPLGNIVKSKIPSDLIKIIGCGIGPQFNINNLRWNKIILAQDADADGNFIKSLASAFIIVTMPELIEDGRLYSAKPPLYTIGEKSVKRYKAEKDWLYDKREYRNFENDIIVNNVIFSTGKDASHPFTKALFRDWLEANRFYLSELEALAKYTACDTDIIEHVCWVLINDLARFHEVSAEKIKEYFKSVFPEMTYDHENKSLYGAYNGKVYSLIMDSVFVKAAKTFMNTMAANNDTIYVTSKNAHEGEFETQTIGQFFKSVYSEYTIDIPQRFKGLSEVDPVLLFTTTMNPKTRKLVRLTMEDRERAIKDMMLLHGAKNVEQRRQLLLNARIDNDDIDN